MACRGGALRAAKSQVLVLFIYRQRMDAVVDMERIKCHMCIWVFGRIKRDIFIYLYS